MIIKLDYADNGLYALKTIFNKKEKNHYIRYVVDEFSIERAIEDIEDNKNVVALDYEGDIQYLNTLKKKPNVPIIITKELKEMNELAISFVMQQIPNWIVVSIKTPEDFCDMRLISRLSEKFPNIRFCGGKFLRLPGCNIGCIRCEDIPEKIPDSKISYYTEKCSCIMTTMHIEDVSGLQYIYRSDMKELENKKMQVDKKKRVIKSLDDLNNF